MVHKARGFTKLDDVFTNPGTLEAEDVTWLKYLRTKFPQSPVTLTSNSPGIATFLAKPELSKQCFITSEPLQATTARQRSADVPDRGRRLQPVHDGRDRARRDGPQGARDGPAR